MWICIRQPSELYCWFKNVVFEETVGVKEITFDLEIQKNEAGINVT